LWASVLQVHLLEFAEREGELDLLRTHFQNQPLDLPVQILFETDVHHGEDTGGPPPQRRADNPAMLGVRNGTDDSTRRRVAESEVRTGE